VCVNLCGGGWSQIPTTAKTKACFLYNSCSVTPVHKKYLFPSGHNWLDLQFPIGQKPVYSRYRHTNTPVIAAAPFVKAPHWFSEPVLHLPLLLFHWPNLGRFRERGAQHRQRKDFLHHTDASGM